MKPTITTIDDAITFLAEHAHLGVIECPFKWEVFPEDEQGNKVFLFGSDEELIAFARDQRDGIAFSGDPSQHLKGGNT